eukprot:6070258-Prymnesium_polylepis.1
MPARECAPFPRREPAVSPPGAKGKAALRRAVAQFDQDALGHRLRRIERLPIDHPEEGLQEARRGLL